MEVKHLESSKPWMRRYLTILAFCTLLLGAVIAVSLIPFPPVIMKAIVRTIAGIAVTIGYAMANQFFMPFVEAESTGPQSHLKIRPSGAGSPVPWGYDTLRRRIALSLRNREYFLEMCRSRSVPSEAMADLVHGSGPLKASDIEKVIDRMEEAL